MMNVELLKSVDELPLDGLMTSCCGLISRCRLRQLEDDSRWSTNYVAALYDGQVVAAVPCTSLRIRNWPDAAYDVGRLLGEDGSSGLDWMLVGGRADRAAGFLRDTNSPLELLNQAATLIESVVTALADEQGRRPASVYANEAEKTFLRMLLGGSPSEAQLTRESRIAVCGDGVGDYVSRLSSSHRSVVVRDWRQRDSLGMWSRSVSWADVMDYAPAMVADVAKGHGAREHPLLVASRLEQWLENKELHHVAFEAGINDMVISVCLGWRWRDVLQLYEVGLAPYGTRARHLAYVESLVYAPIRYAADTGCTEVLLGVDSVTPKRLRGARLSDVFLLAKSR